MLLSPTRRRDPGTATGPPPGWPAAAAAVPYAAAAPPAAAALAATLLQKSASGTAPLPTSSSCNARRSLQELKKLQLQER